MPPVDPKRLAKMTTEEVVLPLPGAGGAAGAIAGRAIAKESTTEVPLPLDGPRLAPPSAAARFEVVRELGAGSFGRVHEALDRTTGKRVALKTLRRDADPTTLARFEREAQAAGRLAHPGIVRVLDAGQKDGVPYIAFELVPGLPLEAWVEQRGPLPERGALGLARDLARALAHAHERGVLHRDVSPANVLVVDEPTGLRPLLADFGLAKDLLARDVLTRTGDVLGTLRCMAPEILGGQAARADERADVYGLGAVLHHALTGKPPFRAVTLAELQQEVAGGATPPRGVSPLTAALLASALRSSRDERPATATAFAELCEAALAKLPEAAARVSGTDELAPADPPRPIAAARPVARRKSLGPVLILLGGVAALGALGLVLGHARDGPRREALALVEQAVGRPPLDEAAAATRALALAPDLPEAYALRALARVHEGDLARAEPDLARAGAGPLATRARAWFAFRRGEGERALELLAREPTLVAERERLAFEDGRALDARDGAASSPDAVVRRALAADRVGPSLDEATLAAATPRLSGEVALRRGQLALARERLGRAIQEGPGTLDGHEALLLRARLSVVELDDDAAVYDVTRATEAPPRERARALLVRERLDAIGRGADDLPATATPPRPLDAALALAAREQARAELERHRLLERPEDLARATRRLRRALVLAPDGETRRLLARALARRPLDNEVALAALADRLVAAPEGPRDALAAARLRIALGDEGAARRILEGVAAPALPPRAARTLAGLRAHLARDAKAAATWLGIAGAGASEATYVLDALRALVLDRPREAFDALECLRSRGGDGALDFERAGALASRDPVTALGLVSRAWRTPVTRDALALLEAVAPATEDRERTRAALVARGFTPGESDRALGLVASRARLVADVPAGLDE